MRSIKVPGIAVIPVLQIKTGYGLLKKFVSLIPFNCLERSGKQETGL
jgi:hypothetical protein